MNRVQNICFLLERLGFVSFRVDPASNLVVEASSTLRDKLFLKPGQDDAEFFVKQFLSNFSPENLDEWKRINRDRTEGKIFFQTDPPVDYSLWIFPWVVPESLSFLCILMPCDSRSDEWYQNCIAQGVESERNRIRSALHENVSQQILGAAFLTKLLSNKLEQTQPTIAGELQEVSRLLNDAVKELQKLVGLSTEKHYTR